MCVCVCVCDGLLRVEEVAGEVSEVLGDLSGGGGGSRHSDRVAGLEHRDHGTPRVVILVRYPPARETTRQRQPDNRQLAQQRQFE